MPTFDVVSELDLQEVKNAIDQAQKEVAQRFDFKGTDASVELKDQTIVIRANSENRVAAVLEVLHGKLVKRGVSLLALDAQPIKAVGGGASQQVINLKQGIDKDGAKKVVKAGLVHATDASFAIRRMVPGLNPVERWFGELSARGAQTLLIYSENDPGLAELERHLGERGRAAAPLPGVRTTTISGADHELTPRSAREALSAALDAFVSDRSAA